jgi:hypothetical protein
MKKAGSFAALRMTSILELHEESRSFVSLRMTNGVEAEKS